MKTIVNQRLVDDFVAELAKPWNGDILDDAVMGCLLESTAMEFVEGNGVVWEPESKRALSRALSIALQAGN
jgi:hypothetical protein